jgi:hypothetical protein
MKKEEFHEVSFSRKREGVNTSLSTAPRKQISGSGIS